MPGLKSTGNDVFRDFRLKRSAFSNLLVWFHLNRQIRSLEPFWNWQNLKILRQSGI